MADDALVEITKGVLIRLRRADARLSACNAHLDRLAVPSPASSAVDRRERMAAIRDLRVQQAALRSEIGGLRQQLQRIGAEASLAARSVAAGRDAPAGRAGPMWWRHAFAWRAAALNLRHHPAAAIGP